MFFLQTFLRLGISYNFDIIIFHHYLNIFPNEAWLFSQYSYFCIRLQVRMFLPKPQKQCDCHVNDPPPWTGEVHGLSQALMSKTLRMRIFWWIVIIICISLGAFTTVLIIIEYIQGPTATSTTIRLVGLLKIKKLIKIYTIFRSTPLNFQQSQFAQKCRILSTSPDYVGILKKVYQIFLIKLQTIC